MFLRMQSGWVRAGGVHSMAGEPGTLHHYLTQWVARDTTNWVVVILHKAGLADVDPGPPLKLRLK